MSADDAKKKALSLLEKRDYSRGELIGRLTDKGFALEDAEAAADRLCELRLIDDAKYAGMVVRHYAAKGFGAARIRQELYKRRVPRELGDEALSELPEQDDTLDILLRGCLRGGETDRDALRRASDALRRRGFSWEEISAAVERYKSERNDE